MSFLRWALVGAVTLAGVACGPAGHQVPMTAMEPQEPPPRQQQGTPHLPQPELGGWQVPGSQVFVPQRAAPGEVLQGRAPVGSRVEFAGKVQEVPQDGRFSLQVPRDARGPLPVRIERPGGRMLVLRILVEEGAAGDP